MTGRMLWQLVGFCEQMRIDGVPTPSRNAIGVVFARLLQVENVLMLLSGLAR